MKDFAAAERGSMDPVTDPERALHLLSRSPVFAGAAPDDLRPLADLGGFSQWPRSGHLFRMGEAVQELYFVSSGSVRVYRFSPNGARELTLSVEGPRQLVAGVAAFQPAYPANAQALQTPTEVLRLPAQAALSAVLHAPALAQAMIGYFARRQADLLGRLDLLVFRELGSRLALYLLEHARPAHDLPTNSELAALLGTVPELVSRKLGEFYRLGLIRMERRRVHVLDPEELRRLAED